MHLDPLRRHCCNFGGLPLARAERDGTVRIEGDRDAVVRIVRAYAGP